MENLENNEARNAQPHINKRSAVAEELFPLGYDVKDAISQMSSLLHDIKSQPDNPYEKFDELERIYAELQECPLTESEKSRVETIRNEASAKMPAENDFR